MTSPADTPVVPHGAWPSPITAALLVQGAAGVSEIRRDGDDVWWSEARPAEGGRTQLVRRSSDGQRHDVLGPYAAEPAAGERNWNVRTAYLEYGGGAWAVREGVVVFVDWADQRLHRLDPGGSPIPITPEPSVVRGWRWSEPTWLDDHWLVCARESHDAEAVEAHGEAVNELVAVPLDGSAAEDPDRVRVLVTGPDFVHAPAVAVDGSTLAWLQWSHPDMPWDSTQLLLGTVERDAGGAPSLEDGARIVAGGDSRESVVQPGFTSAGDLVFCTDRTGWWNPWRVAAGALGGGGDLTAEPMLSGGGVDAEIGGPLWVGGLRWWTELADGRLAVSVTSEGADRLAVVDDGRLSVIDTPFTEIGQVVAGPGSAILVVAGTPVDETGPYSVNLDPEAGRTTIERLRPARDLGLDAGWISVPRHISFPSGERTAHALHYPPANPEVVAPAGERPPLVVMIHGGPSSAARHRFDLAKQFWTSRGFAVVDVNYGGSTGYGRPYRDLLQGGWGIVDVQDAVSAARHLAAEGHADEDRLLIRGGSAGGFTTLAALCFHDSFRAGASHYGVADLAALAADTHKFESRYLDGLVGPWPAASDTYEARSPIHHTDGFDAPLIVLQGSEDEVVPPNQAEMIVDALAVKGVAHAYVLFEGEQHGFRQASNIIRALEAELWFYGRVLGFEPADEIQPVEHAVGL